MAVKRGVADAARLLYNEHATLRYDGAAMTTLEGGNDAHWPFVD